MVDTDRRIQLLKFTKYFIWSYNMNEFVYAMFLNPSVAELKSWTTYFLFYTFDFADSRLQISLNLLGQ